MALLGAAIVLAVGAVAAAFVSGGQDIFSGDEGPSRNEVASTQSEAATTASNETEQSSETGLPDVGRAQMEDEIRTLLLAYHRAIVDRDFRTAWALLSPRKRQQYQEEGGYQKWMAAQASLSPYLSPSGLAVRIDALEGEQVARVMVTGMGWHKPDSPCSEWTGLTWVRYLGGGWTYDPGYSTTPSRRQIWQPRFNELLGAGC